MITPSIFSLESAFRPADAARGPAYPSFCHTILVEHATTRPQLVACFALVLSAVTFALPIRISIAGAALVALSLATPLGAWRSQSPHAKACGYWKMAGCLQQLVGSGARGGALSPVAELVKPAWLHATRSFHSSIPETRT